MRNILTLTAALAAAATLAACSSGGSSSPSSAPKHDTVSSTASSPATTIDLGEQQGPRCADLLGDPDWAAKYTKAGGCWSADGNTLELGSTYFRCKDGSRVYQFADGKTNYWGNSTGQLQTTTKELHALGHDAYGRAVARCVGNT